MRRDARWASVDRFDFAPLDDRWAVVRLLAQLSSGVPAPIDHSLIVHRGPSSSAHAPFASVTDETDSGLVWRTTFAVPLAVVEFPDALFELNASDRAALILPIPSCFLTATQRALRTVGPRWLVRRRLAAMATAFAVTGVSTATPAVEAAIADHVTKSASKPTVPVAAVVKTAVRTQALIHLSLSAPSGLRHRAGRPERRHHRHHSDPAGRTTLTPTKHASATHPHHPHHRTPHPVGPARHPVGPVRHPVALAPSPKTSYVPAPPVTPPPVTPPPVTPPVSGRDPHPPPVSGLSPAPAFAQPSIAGQTSVIAPVESALSALFAGYQGPPPFLIPIYEQAGHRYHVPWTVLAAINWIETDYGRNLRVSSAGAIGWMQFMPSTWAQYGTAWKKHAVPNPYNPRDAILSAARYLAAAGARHNLRRAVFAYNHATWYVDEVFQRARLIGLLTIDARRARGYALPLQAKYMHQFGRTDDGLDIETAPDGAPVYSMTPGVVTSVASDPSGFGPNYPVILVTKGPLLGHFIYYGHVATSLVKVGEHVRAGQPIAIMGHTGDAVSLGHGHIEIGFSDAYGDPTNHHGATAWTTSGASMRTFLTELCLRFGIHPS